MTVASDYDRSLRLRQEKPLTLAAASNSGRRDTERNRDGTTFQAGR